MTNLELAQQQGNQAAPNLIEAALNGELGGGGSSIFEPNLSQKDTVIFLSTRESFTLEQLQTIKSNFDSLLKFDCGVMLAKNYLYIADWVLSQCKNNLHDIITEMPCLPEEFEESISAIDLIEPGYNFYEESDDSLFGIAAILCMLYYKTLGSDEAIQRITTAAYDYYYMCARFMSGKNISALGYGETIYLQPTAFSSIITLTQDFILKPIDVNFNIFGSSSQTSIAYPIPDSYSENDYITIEVIKGEASVGDAPEETGALGQAVHDMLENLSQEALLGLIAGDVQATVKYNEADPVVCGGATSESSYNFFIRTQSIDEEIPLKSITYNIFNQE